MEYSGQIKKKYERKKSKTGGFNFVVCIDGSDKSMRCIEEAHRFAFDPNDRVYAVCLLSLPISLECKREDIEEQVKEKVSEMKITCPVDFISAEGKACHDVLLNYINIGSRTEFDFVVVLLIFSFFHSIHEKFGRNGFRAQKHNNHEVGRTAQVLIRNSSINPIMIP